jgi:hypothetical protein
MKGDETWMVLLYVLFFSIKPTLDTRNNQRGVGFMDQNKKTDFSAYNRYEKIMP